MSLAFIPFSEGYAGGAPAALQVTTLELKMQSILEILLVSVKAGKSKKTGNDYSISEAHCVLRNADGSAGAVGVLVVPKNLEEVAKPGMFTASFGLIAGSYGETQGRIVAVLAGLVPVPSRSLPKTA